MAESRSIESERIRPKSKWGEVIKKKPEQIKTAKSGIKSDPAKSNKSLLNKIKSLFGIRISTKKIHGEEVEKTKEGEGVPIWKESIETLRIGEEACNALKMAIRQPVMVKGFPPLITQTVPYDIIEHILSETESEEPLWDWKQNPPKPVKMTRQLGWSLSRGRKTLDAHYLEKSFGKYKIQGEHPTTLAHIHPKSLHLLKAKVLEWESAFWGIPREEQVRPSIFAETREMIEEYHKMIRSLLATKETLENPEIWKKPGLANVTYSKTCDAKTEEAWDIVSEIIQSVGETHLPKNFPWTWEEMLFSELVETKNLPSEWPTPPPPFVSTYEKSHKVDWLPNKTHIPYETESKKAEDTITSKNIWAIADGKELGEPEIPEKTEEKYIEEINLLKTLIEENPPDDGLNDLINIQIMKKSMELDRMRLNREKEKNGEEYEHIELNLDDDSF